MNRLLALADFSPASETALRYAAALADSYSIPLTLLHLYVVPVPFTPDDMALPLLLDTDTRGLAEARLADLLAQMREEFPMLSLQSRLLYGDIESALDAGEEHPLDGHTLFLANDVTAGSSWLTTDVPAVLRNAPRTVLAVPEGTSYHPVKAIGLALDPAKAENLPIAPLLDWVRLTGARLHIVCVGPDEQPVPDTVKAALLPAAPEYHFVTGTAAVENGLLHFVRTMNLDWLALTPHSHGFLAGLFHKGLIQALAKDAPVPLLALHAPTT